MCSKSRYIYRYLLVLTILSLPQILLGQTTYTWIGDNSSWNASFNWSPSGVPGPADTAVVETGTTMIIDSDVEVGGFRMSDGILTGTSSLTVNGRMYWQGGTIEAGDSLYIPFGATLLFDGTASALLDARPISCGGLIRWTNTGKIRVKNNAVILLKNTALFFTRIFPVFA